MIRALYLLPLLALLGKPVLAAEEALTVYKSPTCGCCIVWISHLEEYGFTATVNHPDDFNSVKKKLGITSRTASCHTAVSEQGYVFEGHVPARYIEAFLAKPPTNAIGLSVPAMPVGSPGMEAGDRFQPYDVLQLNDDGSTSIYASVKTLQQQYE